MKTSAETKFRSEQYTRETYFRLSAAQNHRRLSPDYRDNAERLIDADELQIVQKGL